MLRAREIWILMIVAMSIMFLLTSCLTVQPQDDVEYDIPMNSLQLWLRADAGVVVDDGNRVTVWRDQSWQENHAVAPEGSEPEYSICPANGSPAVKFDGSQDFVQVGHSDKLNVYGELSVIVVYSYTGGFRLLQKKDASGVDADAWFVTPASGLGVGGQFTQQELFERGAVLHLQTNVFDAQVGTLKTYKNGALVSAVEVSNEQASNEDDLYIGMRNHIQGTKGHLKGEILEILIYNRVLSSDEQEAVEQYLRDKYDL